MPMISLGWSQFMFIQPFFPTFLVLFFFFFKSFTLTRAKPKRKRLVHRELTWCVTHVILCAPVRKNNRVTYMPWFRLAEKWGLFMLGSFRRGHSKNKKGNKDAKIAGKQKPVKMFHTLNSRQIPLSASAGPQMRRQLKLFASNSGREQSLTVSLLKTAPLTTRNQPIF